jgi:hypothetical protein
MWNWTRRLLTLVLPALMILVAAPGAEANMGYGYQPYLNASAPAAAPSYGSPYGGAAYGSYGALPSPARTFGSTGIRGYGSQTGQSWEALAALQGGGGDFGAGVCPFCPRGGGGTGDCPYCNQQSAASQDGGGGTCPFCINGNCDWCQQNGAQAYAAAGDGGGCPWCVDGQCNCGPGCSCGPNGCNCGPNCNCAAGGNCPNCWQNQGRAPFGGEQLAQAYPQGQAYGQSRAYQAMQGMPYGI